MRNPDSPPQGDAPARPAAAPAAIPGIAPGDRLGRWEILSILGQGAHGVVCAAWDAGDRPGAESEGAASAGAVTLKLPRDFREAAAGETDALLRREAEVLARIRHPNVAAARGVELVEDRACLLLEPIEGESLAVRLDRDRAGEPGAGFDGAALTTLLGGLAAGLEAVHEAGFLHGDVKPANIFIRPDGAPLLVDFGSAAPRDATPDERGAAGHASAGYAAIEQYDSDAREGPWTDLYGLAAVAYRIVAGRPPPPAPSRAAGEALLSAVRAGRNRYSEALLEAIDQGLRLDPAQRPRGLSDWLARLGTAAATPAQTPAPAPAPTPAPTPDQAPARTEGARPVIVPPRAERLDETAPHRTEAAGAPPASAEAGGAEAGSKSLPEAVPERTPLAVRGVERQDVERQGAERQDVARGEPLDSGATLDDLPPTEKVTRLPLAMRLAGEPGRAGGMGQDSSLRAATLRAERRERALERPPPGRRASLAFVVTALVLAAVGFGGWEGYLRFIKSEWLVDPAGGGDATSVTDALRRARDGANLRLAPGRYSETILLDSAVNLIGPENPETPAVVEPTAGPCLLSTAGGASVTRLVLLRPAAAAPPADLPAAVLADGGSCLVIGASLRVEDSRVSSAQGPAVVIRDGADPALTRVSVGQSAGAGIVVEGGAGGTILESTILSSGKSGILVREAAHPTVTGSRIEGSAQAGILVTGGGGGVFADNDILGSAASGVEVREGADPELRDNRISGAEQAGIYVYDGGKGRFTGNRIADNGFSGVVIATEGAPELSGNEITGNGEHGIAILETGAGRIADNRIDGNRGHGIVRADGSPAEIGDNRLSGNQDPQLQVGRRPGA